MMKLAIIAAMLGTAELPPEAQIVAKPTGGWQITKSGYECRLSRAFSADDKPVWMTIAREPLQTLSWTRVAWHDKASQEKKPKATLFVDGKTMADDIHFNVKNADDLYIREFMTDYRDHGLADTQASVRFSTPKSGDIEILADRFQAGWAGLDACMNDIYRQLDVDVAEYNRVVTPAKGKIFDHIRNRPNAGFDLTLLYWVEADGSVSKCVPLHSSEGEKMGTKTCERLIEKAKFEPALDVDGKPVRAPVYDAMKIRVFESFTVL